MSTDPERRSICYPNRGFPAQTACHLPPVSCIAPVTWRVPMPNLRPEVRRSGWRLIRICMSLTAFTLAWLGASTSYLPPNSQHEESTAASTVDAVVERIIDVESGGDPNAKNKRSSATGLGQFLDETWLDMIRAHRPDLAKGRNQNEILELRRDAKVAREIIYGAECRDAEEAGSTCDARNALFGALCWWRGSCGYPVSN